MADEGSRRPRLRASDADRERAVRVLREAAVEGRLAHDSFVRRIDLALAARDRGTLAAVTADLSPAGERQPLAVLQRLLRSSPRPRPLWLPRDPSVDYSVGRSRACDLVLHDPSVSRRHAALRCFGDQWFVEDLGSTNGTRVNGFRVRRSVPVDPGDVVAFAGAVFRLRAARRR